MKDEDFEELNLENEKEEDFDLSSKRTIFTEQGDPEVDSLYRRHLKGVLTPQIAGHNLKNKLGLIKFGNYDNNKKEIYT